MKLCSKFNNLQFLPPRSNRHPHCCNTTRRRRST